MEVKKAYDDHSLESELTGLDCQDPSLAIQSAKEESDINTIVRRFGLTGQLPNDVRVPSFGDFTEVVDFHTAMNAVAMANESFMAMPAEVRSRFGNDPQAFVAFCSDEGNLEEMRKLGLAVPKAEPVVDPLLQAVRDLKPRDAVPEGSSHRV